MNLKRPKTLTGTDYDQSPFRPISCAPLKKSRLHEGQHNVDFKHCREEIAANLSESIR